MSRKPDAEQYKGGFIPDEMKSLNPCGCKEEKLDNWQGKSDREENLSDPRWHKRPPMKKKTPTSTPASTTTSIEDTRELISSRPTPVKKFLTITFTEENSKTKKQCILKMKTTVVVQTDNNHVLVVTQTELGEEHPETNEMFVSRINFDIASQEEYTPNEEPSIMTGRRSSPPQLEASHHEIADNIVATVNQTKMTEAEEDTPLFRQRLQKVLGAKFIAAATKKDRNLRQLINFVKKRDWEAIKSACGQYWFNIRNRLHVREDCLLIDERIFIQTQLRQTILESLHLTHPGSAVMLDLCQNVWFPHIHRSIVQMANNCEDCTEEDIEDPTAPQHAIFREDETTALAKKLTRKEQRSAQNSPNKRRGKPMGKRTGGSSCDKPRRMILSYLQKITKPKASTTETITHSDTESNKSSNSEEAAEPSPNRIDQKNTPPATTSTVENMVPSRRSTRHRQPTLAKAFGNPIPINNINESDSSKKLNFKIDSPSDQIYSPEKPSLKSLIQEIGFTDKSPEYRACMTFLEAISPKYKAKNTDEVFDLISSDESPNKIDILCIEACSNIANTTETKRPQRRNMKNSKTTTTIKK